MSKPLPRIDFDPRQARLGLEAFDALLGHGETKELEEAAEILPFFKAHPHLAALAGCCAHPGIGFPDLAKPEYGVLGSARLRSCRW